MNDIVDLIDAYAEARHRCGCAAYNATTADARQLVADYIASIGAGGVQALSAAQNLQEGFLRDVVMLCSNQGASPESIESFDSGDKWIADLWRKANTLLAASPTPTHTPTALSAAPADNLTRTWELAEAWGTAPKRAASPTPPAEQPDLPAGPCVICGSDEPFTGTCGSGDPRALCKQATPKAAPHFGPLRDADAEYGKQLSVYNTPKAEQQAATPEAATPKGDATTGAALGAEPGAVYAELPEPDSWFHLTAQYWENKLLDFADRTHALRQADQDYSEKWDAELGRAAMRFVDRAGDVHPGIDDAETICAEFHKAKSEAIERMPHVQRMAAPKAAAGERPSDADIDAFLDSPGNLNWVIADKRERYRLLVRAVLAKWAAPQQEATKAAPGEPSDTQVWAAMQAFSKHDSNSEGMRAALIAGAAAPQPAPAPLSEREAFEAKFGVPGGVHWDVDGYVVNEDHLKSYLCNIFVGQWKAWQARAALSAQRGWDAG